MRRGRFALLCAMIGCGPAVQVPASTDSDSGDESRTGPMADTGTPWPTSAGPGDGSSVPGNPTDPRYDVNDSPFDFLVECPASREVGPLLTSVAVLVDASQTMATQMLDHDGDPGTPDVTRWSMLATALEEHLPNLAVTANVGIQSFPSFEAAAPPDADACLHEVDGPAPPATGDALLDYLPPASATWFLGATPTAAAVLVAWQSILSNDAGAERRILMLTDGAPNCTMDAQPPELFDDVDLSAEGWIHYLFHEGIFTHVVGIDVPEGTSGGGPEGDAITDHRARLDDLALNSGVLLTLVDDAVSLDAALTDFAVQAQSCRLRIPGDILHMGWIEVELAGEAVYWVDDAQCHDGVDGYRGIDTPEGDTIEFCGTLCDAFREAGVATVTATCSFPE